MRTTINIDSLYEERLHAASEILKLSKSDIVSLLLDELLRKNSFKIKPFETITYQESDPDIDWLTMHVCFVPMVYEKAQDLKRYFKFSTSWFVAFAVVKFLDELVSKLLGIEKIKKNLDNYGNNIILITKMFGNIQGFITIWGIPESEALDEPLI